MNELIKVTYDNERPTVLGRELHEYLEVETKYTDWFSRMCEYGFVDGVDHCSFLSNGDGFGKAATRTDHQLTIDMAKEICMLQRNEKGKQARQYFINLEKAWNSPEMVMSRALRMAETQINSLQAVNSNLLAENKQQEQIIGELKPKADYTDRILRSTGTVTITSIAKDYGMSGNAFNKLLHELKIQYKQGDIWLLYRNHQSKGFTHSKSFDYTDSKGMPQVRMSTEWTQKGRLFLYQLLKNNEILPMIERGEMSA